MESTAHRLAIRVSSVDEAEISTVRTNIEYLDSLNSRFSELALQIFDLPEKRGVYSARSRLRDLGNHSDLSNAKRQAYKLTQRTHHAISTPEYLLSAAYISYAVASIDFIDPGLLGATQHAVRENDALIAANNVAFKPEVFGPLEANIRYYQSLAAAAYILDISPSELRVIDETLLFVEWAVTRTDFDRAVFLAYRIESVSPSNLEPILALQEETPQSLHGGLV